MTDLQSDRGFALEQAGHDEELLAELLTLLRQSTMADLQRMKQAVAGGDGRALSNAAHNTKGAASSLGMESLCRVAGDLERAGRDGELGGVAAQLAVFEEMVSQLSTVR